MRIVSVVTGLCLLLLPAAILPAQAAGLTVVGRNPHGYLLKLDMLTFVNGGWQGDADFSLSACPQIKCFHLAGSLLFPGGDGDAAFPVAGMKCILHFEAGVSSLGLPDGGYHITPVSRAPDAKGCAALPADLAGFYKQIPGAAAKPHA